MFSGSSLCANYSSFPVLSFMTQRQAGYITGKDDVLVCDRFLTDGWYIMPGYAISNKNSVTCGTTVPWFLKGNKFSEIKCNDIIIIINISDKFRICIALLITLLSNWKCQFGQLVIFSDDLPVTKGEVYIKACRNDESYCQQLSVERCKDDFLFYIRHTRECDEAYCIGCILMYTCM